MKELGNYTTEQLKQELENRGFFTRNLWTIEDVEWAMDRRDKEDQYTVSLEEKFQLLDSALTGEGTMAHINEAIEIVLDDYNEDTQRIPFGELSPEEQDQSIHSSYEKLDLHGQFYDHLRKYHDLDEKEFTYRVKKGIIEMDQLLTFKRPRSGNGIVVEIKQ